MFRLDPSPSIADEMADEDTWMDGIHDAGDTVGSGFVDSSPKAWDEAWFDVANELDSDNYTI